MMPDGILNARECPIVEERRLQRRVAQWRTAELVTIGTITRELLTSEIFVRARTRKNHVTLVNSESGSHLWNRGYVHLEIGKHLVRSAGYGMARYAARLAEEQECAFLLGNGHCLGIAARELIHRCIGKHQCEFEFGDGPAEHGEVDQPSASY